MSFVEKLLERSNSYNYYKKNYFALKKSNKKLKKKLKKKNKDVNNLNITYGKIASREKWFSDRFEKDYIYTDTDSLMAKFHVNPIIKPPFSRQAIRGFSFMDHFAKYLEKQICSENHPLVSIIFPVYNYQKDIIDAINSVLNQTYANFELIVIDDSSDDDTIDMVKSIADNRIKLIVNQESKGLSYCRNEALKKCRGEYIFYLNMDNFWTKKYLTVMMGAFKLLPDADALYSGNYIFDKASEELLAVIFGTYNKQLLYNRNYISLSSFAHKNIVNNKVSFDEQLDDLEDWDFLIKVSKQCNMYSVPILQSKSFKKEFTQDQIKKVHDKIGNYPEDFSKKHELKKKISIILPSFELYDDLKECIDKILSFNSNLIDIIVVDNNSNQKVRDYLKEMNDLGKLKYIQNEINYSFTYAVEQGIEISDKDSDILLLNNDAILTDGALEAMQYYAHSLEDCGIIVPQEVLYPKDSKINFHIPFADDNFECNVSVSKAHSNIFKVPLFHNGDVIELKFAPFFCTYIPRHVYDKTLGLDSELGRHYNSDRIYSDFIRHVLKLKIYHIFHAKVYHKTQKSTKELKKKDNDEYNMIFLKNSWEKELTEKLGYEIPIWKDYDN